MAFIAKQDISTVNWSIFNSSDGKAILERLGIPAKASWYLPQLMALIGSSFHVKRREDGKFSFKETIASLGGQCEEGTLRYQDGTKISKEALKGLLGFLAHYPRSEILPSGLTQCSELGSRWAAGVPLILSAFKEFRGIGYNDWAWDEEDKYIKWMVGIDFVMKPAEKVSGLRGVSLLDLIRESWVPPWSNEELCQLTEAARPWKTGQKAGQLRNYNQMTSFSATGLDLEFDKLGTVGWFKPMLCQTWVFQPHIISKYAINNTKDLDIQVPSIRGDLVLKKTTKDNELDEVLFG